MATRKIVRKAAAQRPAGEKPAIPDTPAAAPSTTDLPTSPSKTQFPMHELNITVAGSEHVVRRALTSMSFGDEWNHAATREIALNETLVADAGLDDTLGGQKIAMFSQDARDLYRQRCVNEAGHRGHPVPNPADIPADADTTVMEVGDALFDHSRH